VNDVVDVVLGAYAASPSLEGWDADRELEYLQQVTAIPGVSGLELPWTGALHAHDPEWLLTSLPTGLRCVVTAIPGTVAALAADPAVGLASTDGSGRAEALRLAARLRDDVARLVDAGRDTTVVAVELHSAPRGDRGGVDAFRRSLDEVAGWDWNGAELVIEHCDAFIDGQPPAKGYLTLEGEIAAARDAGVGIGLNWGRSAIELRDPDRVVEHVAIARDSGLLRGIIVSGAADQAGPLGGAWVDAHHPFAASEVEWGDPASVLTPERMRAALAAAGPLDFVGFKLGWGRPGAPVADRVAMLREAVALLP
jgi:hypothetical protein